MNFMDVVKTVGSGVLSVIPGGSAVLGVVNAFLPDEDKLPDNATANQVNAAVSNLTPGQRAEIMHKEFEVDITQIKESHSTVRAMLEADAKNPHSTRPYIAKHSFHLIAVISLITALMWAYGVGAENDMLVKTVMNGWPFVLAIVSPFVVLLKAYFGILKQENKNKLDAAQGITPTPIKGFAGVVNSFLNR